MKSNEREMQFKMRNKIRHNVSCLDKLMAQSRQERWDDI